MDLSYQEKQELIRKKLPEGAWITDIYDDHIIYEEKDYRGYEAPYSILDGQVTLGDKVEVQRKVMYVKMQAAMQLTAAMDGRNAEDSGYKWEVRIVEFGPDKQGLIFWDAPALKAAVPLYEGAKVFALAEAQHQALAHPYGKSVRDLVGWLDGVASDEKGLKGYFNILKSAKWLRDMVMDSAQRGRPDLIGLSHDVAATTTVKTVAGKKMKSPVEIKSVTVDVVYEPAAGGQFLRMAAAAAQNNKTEGIMEKLLAALKAKKPDAYASIEAKVKDGTITEDEVVELLTAAPKAPPQGAPAGTGGDDTLKATQKALEETRIVACSITLEKEVFASGLPELSQARLKKLFAGKVFEAEGLRAAIKDEKEYVDKLTASGGVTGSGDVKMLRAAEDKLQAAMDKLFAVKTDAKYNDIPGFKSIRAAYAELTGDAEVRGYSDNPQRLKAAFDSGTFVYALGNSLYRRTVQDYKEVSDYGVSRLVSNKRNAKDFRSLESIKVSYFGDLPDVTPETVDYPELGALSDEKVDYTLGQRGAIVTITRKMIINDDMDLVGKIVKRLPRAARRTLAKKVWNKFITNATYKGDNKAIFHADHGNLGSAAYSVAALVAGIKALKGMSEPGSAEKLMLKAKTVSIPTDLWDVATKINRTQGDPGTANHGNPLYQFFGPNEEGILENPFQSDANDWMLIADPNDVEIVELAFLNGQEEPEIFVADNPAAGQFFVADKIQYKIRHEYEPEVVDYRGVYKAVVA